MINSTGDFELIVLITRTNSSHGGMKSVFVIFIFLTGNAPADTRLVISVVISNKVDVNGKRAGGGINWHNEKSNKSFRDWHTKNIITRSFRNPN